MSELPLLLAGPIVRRAEPDTVSVWVALAEARTVRLSIWQGVTDAGPGEGLFTGEAPLFSGDTTTIRIGERLHVAVVTAEPDSALTAGQTYAYNVGFGPPGGSFSATADLKSLGLLENRAAVATGDEATGDDATGDDATGDEATGDEARLAHLALGYEPNQLPTLIMPPPELTDLRIAHGSCRRPHAEMADLLPALDELIEAHRGVPAQRPQQLFLGGDQIYADDVAPGLLHLLTGVGNELLGAVEQLPTRWSLDPSDGGVRLEPSLRSRFPAGLRKPVVMDDARLTTVDGHSHLLSLGEYCAMHLMCWSNELWPVTMPSYQDLFWRQTLGELDNDDEILAGIALPPDIWRLLTGLGFETAHGLTTRYPADPPTFEPQHVGELLGTVASDEKAAKAYADQVKVLTAFRDGLPRARRALANIATYMICDDHEVTDDWNLSQIWRDRVLTSPLGRTVLRNGMVAYALCQAWGNDPARFAAADAPEHRLLTAIPRLFAASEELPPHTATSDEIDQLLGLDGGEPPVRFDYRVSGSKHRVIVLDVRTRRAFTSRVSPPSNLSAKALKEQVPEGPLPDGLEVLFVVAPLPVFGLPVIDEIGGALAYRAWDATHHADIAGMPGTNPDAVEAWVNDPITLEALLARLAPYRKVVILSGDVHYGHSGGASYWAKDDEAPSRIAQLTSSGIKNAWPDTVVTLSRSFAFVQAVERLENPVELLGWDDDDPVPLRTPDGVDLLPPARARLRRTPVLLPTHGWPAGTVIERPPDWSWRFRLARDTRAIEELPELARPEPLDPDAPTADVTLAVDGYRLTAARHAQQASKVPHTRQVLFHSNIGIVTFDRADGRLRVRHELHAQPEGTATAAVFTRHTIVLEPAADDPAEQPPTIGAES